MLLTLYNTPCQLLDKLRSVRHLGYPKLDDNAIFLEPVIGGSGKDSGQSHTATVEAVYYDSEHRFYQGRLAKAEYRKVCLQIFDSFRFPPSPSYTDCAKLRDVLVCMHGVVWSCLFTQSSFVGFC